MDVKDISEELKEKIQMIESETNFFANKPPKPRSIASSVVAFIGLIIVSCLFAWRAFNGDGEYESAFIFLLYAGFIFNQYIEQKRLYKLYSNACEIILHYKKQL